MYSISEKLIEARSISINPAWIMVRQTGQRKSRFDLIFSVHSLSCFFHSILFVESEGKRKGT